MCPKGKGTDALNLDLTGSLLPTPGIFDSDSAAQFQGGPSPGTGRRHQTALEMDQAEENLSSPCRVRLSSQGSKVSFHGNQNRILANEATNRAGFRFSSHRENSDLARGGGGERESWPLLLSCPQARDTWCLPFPIRPRFPLPGNE